MYIYTQISSCPAGYLRHRAYCVLCSGVAKAQRKQTHKATTTTKNGVQNWAEIMKKWRPGGSRRLLGEVLGQFWLPGVPQRGPRDAGSRKSDEKFVHPPFVPYLFCPLKSHIFDVFRFFQCFWGDVFRKRFLEASGHHFWRILEWFPTCFFVFFWRCWAGRGSKKNVVLYCVLQCFWNIDLFEKSEKLKKYV